jgi:hypothetical protein
MEPGDSIPHTQGLSNNPYLSQINKTPRIDVYFLFCRVETSLPRWLPYFYGI